MQYNVTVYNDTAVDGCTFAISGYAYFVNLKAGETKTVQATASADDPNTVSTTLGGNTLTVNYDQGPKSVWYSASAKGAYQMMAIYAKADGDGKGTGNTTVTLSPMATLYNDLHNVAVFFKIDGTAQPEPLSVSQVRALRAPEKSVTASFTPPSPPSPAPPPGSAAVVNDPVLPDIVLTVPAYKDKSETVTGGGARLVSSKDPSTGTVSYRVQIDDPASTLAVFSRPRPQPSPTPLFIPHHTLTPVSVTAIALAAVFYILFMVFLALYLYDR